VDATLTLEDAATGQRLTLRWTAVGADDKLAHASYLVALNTALLGGRGSVPGIRLTKLDLKGQSLFAVDELLRLASLMANSYAIAGGRDYTGVILSVADQLGLVLPNLLARAPS